MKQKTKRGAMKRFRITRNGKVIRRKATGNHMLRKKGNSQKRRIEGYAVVTAEAKTIKRLLGE